MSTTYVDKYDAGRRDVRLVESLAGVCRRGGSHRRGTGALAKREHRERRDAVADVGAEDAGHGPYNRDSKSVSFVVAWFS